MSQPEPAPASLLERAKAIPRGRVRKKSFDEDDYELAIALLAGDITCAQAGAAWGMGRAGGSVQVRAFAALRAAYREGLRFRWEANP